MRIQSTLIAFTQHKIIRQLTETPPLISRENHIQPAMHVPRTKGPRSAYREYNHLMTFPRPLVAFLLLWIACLLLHIYIGPRLSSEMPEETSRERELLELRILHER